MVANPVWRTRLGSKLVRLLKHGGRQVVPIPRGWELPGETALVTKHGARLILEPIEKRNFIEVLRTLGPLPPEDWFPDIDEDLPPAEPVDFLKMRRLRWNLSAGDGAA